MEDADAARHYKLVRSALMTLIKVTATKHSPSRCTLLTNSPFLHPLPPGSLLNTHLRKFIFHIMRGVLRYHGPSAAGLRDGKRQEPAAVQGCYATSGLSIAGHWGFQAVSLVVDDADFDHVLPGLGRGHAAEVSLNLSDNGIRDSVLGAEGRQVLGAGFRSSFTHEVWRRVGGAVSRWPAGSSFRHGWLPRYLFPANARDRWWSFRCLVRIVERIGRNPRVQVPEGGWI